MSVICQAKPLVRRFIVELEQNADFPEQHFSIKNELHILPGPLSDIADKNGSIEPSLSSDKKRQKTCSYGLKTPLIESISWQWLYAANLLVVFELILTTKDAPTGFNLYSSLPLEAVVAVGWLLNNYRNPVSSLFNPYEQQEASINDPLSIITMTPGSERNPSQYQTSQYQPSQASGQQAPRTTPYPEGSFTSPWHSGFGDDNEDPQSHRHTLGLNCFVYPCNGVCRFRPSFDNAHSLSAVAACTVKTRPLTMFWHLPVTTDDLLIINGLLNLGSHGLAEKNPFSISLIHCTPPAETLEAQQTTASTQWNQNLIHPSRTAQAAADKIIFTTSDNKDSQTDDIESAETSSSGCLPYTGANHCQQGLLDQKKRDHSGQHICVDKLLGEDGQQRLCGRVCSSIKALSDHKRRHHSGPRTCCETVLGEDGQPQLCGKVCKSIKNLSDHKRRHHTGQQTCAQTVLGKDGQPQLCGKVCNNIKALSDHKRRHHSGQKICGETVLGEDGQPCQCGKVCKSSQILAEHKRISHSGQKTCDATLIGKDGQLQPCRRVFKNAHALSAHRSFIHSGQRTCSVTVVTKSGQKRPCRMLCKNAQSLADHKRRNHTRQQTCDMLVVGEDGMQQPCGKPCKSAKVMSDHKRRKHGGQQTCNLTLVGEDGMQRPCKTICKNPAALSTHKSSVHSGQKTCDLNMVGKDGRQRLCRKICKNAQALRDHKRTHRKRNPVNDSRDDDFSP
ncbi:hypothetical protein [Endozoicomonas sp. ALC020]|uniref:hypothetical protein n=1 Tax=unclassified Endozoicomonas TaxID=2644528 RepID=UPI003BB125EB